jgi:hypothetical protein
MDHKRFSLILLRDSQFTIFATDQVTLNAIAGLRMMKMNPTSMVEILTQRDYAIEVWDQENEYESDSRRKSNRDRDWRDSCENRSDRISSRDQATSNSQDGNARSDRNLDNIAVKSTLGMLVRNDITRIGETLQNKREMTDT